MLQINAVLKSILWKCFLTFLETAQIINSIFKITNCYLHKILNVRVNHSVVGHPTVVGNFSILKSYKTVWDKKNLFVTADY